MASITEQIYSNDYKDYIIPYSNTTILDRYKDFGIQMLDSRYALIHDSAASPLFPIQRSIGLYHEYPYIPKLFAPLSTVSLETTGIIQSQTQPYLNLNGRHVLLGFVDTGIDYLHPAFSDRNGNSRILSIWDQSDPSGSSENAYQYGTVYEQFQIDQALKSESPYLILPTYDEQGHGTALAGIAAGTPDPQNDFTGVAYDAKISVVKLKKAKPYLYDYYFADKNASLYQENDIMTGIRFLLDQSRKYQLPLIICIGLGTNQGDHNGNSAISQMISNLSYDTYTAFSIACGNEGNKRHHTFQTLQNTYEDVQIQVPENTPGFVAELWGSVNALLSIGFQTPLGTQIPPIAVRPGQTELIPFILEQTRIELSYSITTESIGHQLVAFRISDPTPGEWIIRVYKNQTTDSSFHMWLPITGILTNEPTFYNPDPDTTLTIPSDSMRGIATTYYNGYNQSFSAESSRGYTLEGDIKPSLSTPGINLTVPNLRQTYSSFSGSSGAAALLAGCMALLQQWRMDMPIAGIFDSAILNGYLIRGAVRDETITYPNRQWGYGKLNLYEIFRSLMD